MTHVTRRALLYPQAILWDLDSTLADTLHRQPMVAEIKARTATWEEYSLRCPDDTPIDGAVTLAWLLHPFYHQVIVSGRSQVAVNATWEWLRRYNVPCGKFKARAVRDLRARGLRPVLFVEDFPDAAAYIRDKTRLPVLLVSAGCPADAPHADQGGA